MNKPSGGTSAAFASCRVFIAGGMDVPILEMHMLDASLFQRGHAAALCSVPGPRATSWCVSGRGWHMATSLQADTCLRYVQTDSRPFLLPFFSTLCV